VPPIIETGLYAAAMLQRAKNRVHLVGRPAEQLYLLRGLLKCAGCGGGYGSHPNGGRRAYLCRRSRDGVTGERCRMPSLGAKTAEAAVRDALAGALRDPATLHRAVEAWLAERQDRDAAIKAEMTGLTKRLHATEVKVRRLLDLLTDGDGVPADEIKSRLAALTRERDGLRVQLAEAQARAAAVEAGGAKLAAVERYAVKAAR